VKRRRSPRRDIRGTDGVWRINANGDVFKYDRRQPLQPPGKDIAGLPTINFGHRHIQGIGGTLVVPAYLGPVPSSGLYRDTCRLLEEIACVAFHGYPLGGFTRSVVVHADADNLNCAADNLRWEIDEEQARYAQEMATKRLMRPDFLPRKVICGPVTKSRKNIAWIESLTVPGRVPVGALSFENEAA
jgi:hypothetical protein